jgi:4-amino-4-deoxy-L-arabinose transferase-like glycosyltransferase
VSAEEGPGAVPARPALLPRGSRRRWCLALLLAFTFLKGLVWAVTVPAFWASDEDYHFLYVEHLVTQGAIVDPDRPIYPREYGKATEAILYDSYGQGARREFDGDPKATIRALEALPDSFREPVDRGRGVGVVHPPLYQLAGAAADKLAGDASILTRLTVVRSVSAAFAALAVYMAWLMASQVLSRFRLQILVAALLSLQPIFSFLSGVVNHDSALIAFFTGSMAMMLFVVRTPPRARQGLWLGVVVTLALLVKGTALVLLPLAAAALLAQGLVHRRSWRAAARSGGVAFGAIALLAGWWYVRAKLAYGSFTGATTGLSGGPMPVPGAKSAMGSAAGAAAPAIPAASIGEYLSWVREWLALTYRTYWFHFLFFETPGPRAAEYWLPLLAVPVGIAGIGRAVWQLRRRLLDPGEPLLRQILLMAAAAAVVFLPFLGVDLVRRADGLGFFATGGRYLLPAYPCVAALLVVALCRLLKGRPLTLALGLTAVGAIVMNVRVYDRYWLNRYFGQQDVDELLRRLSFDRPEFVTPVTIALVGVLAMLAFAGAAVLAVREAPTET